MAARPPRPRLPGARGAGGGARPGLEGSADVGAAAGAPAFAEGPARSGALGPAGEERFGPSPSPVYALYGSRLAALASDAPTLTCLLDRSQDWSSCPLTWVADLGGSVLDVALSAGDRTVAARRLDLSASSCQACGADDALCQRQLCPLAPELRLARAGRAPTTLALPAAPLALAADRAGGFVASLACAGGAPLRCFGAGGPCDAEAFPVAAPALSGALLLVPEDGGAPAYLAVGVGLAGKVAVAPGGAEAWVASGDGDALFLTRVGLARRTADAGIDTTAPQAVLSRQRLGAGERFGAGFAPTGVAFTPDGATGVVTVPAESRVVLFE